MIAAIVLPHDLRARIEREARTTFPKECCGLIEGIRENNTVRVTAVHPTRNLAAAPDRFEIDPAEHIRLLRALRGTGREIVGCYHSHPNGLAEPSPHDREAAAEENFIWLIVAVSRDGAVPLAAFVFRDDDFIPVPLAA